MSENTRRRFFLLCAVLILAAFFRFYAITEIPPGLWPDEAANGVNALAALKTGDFKIFYPENNGREGLYINIQALAVKVFGPQAWALRVVSAAFGTLTVLGLYLVVKELLSVKSQTTNPKPQTNPKTQAPNSKRFGILYFGHWNLEFGIPRGNLIALLSAFLLATSYWHINFSRIGFRAVMVPFLAVFGLYWLLKALDTGKISGAVFGGIFTGLGFHTYIAFRFMPFVLAVPIIISLREWWQENQKSKVKSQNENAKSKNKPCVPCIVALFLFVTFVVALPIGLYFLNHPEDFASRAAPLSIFAAESPLKALAKSTALTLGMFNFVGDCNPRHNLPCRAELYWPVGIFFLLGLILTIRQVLKNPIARNLTPITLLTWFFVMLIPAVLTREGLPHALRTIGAIPPVFILAGLGAGHLVIWIQNSFRQRLESFTAKPENAFLEPRLKRIKREAKLLLFVLLIWIAAAEGVNYFLRWAPSPAVEHAFETSKTELSNFILKISETIPVYVLVNEPSLLVNGISLNAQPVVFLTSPRANTFFIRPEETASLPGSLEKAVFVGLHTDRAMLAKIKERYPNSKTLAASGDIVPLVVGENAW